jgi:ubiquitin-conjugating enzyme E2 S
VIRDLARELKNLDDSPPEDIKVYANEENFSNLTADIGGPCKAILAFLSVSNVGLV